MTRRPRRSLPATLTGLVLLALCVVAAVVAIQMIIGAKAWIDYGAVTGILHEIRWSDPLPAAAGAVAAALGLLLLLVAFLPGAPTVLPVRGGLDAGISRGSYRSTLRSAAVGVDGVSDAAVKLGRRRVRVRVDTGRTRPEGLVEAVGAAVGHRLDQLDPLITPAVAVRVRAPRRST